MHDPWAASRQEYYPVFEWEEEDPFDDNTETRGGNAACVPGPPNLTYHTQTMLPDGEGLLVDTGAVDNLTGFDFVARQSKASERHGLKTKWLQLDRPKSLSGIGDAAKRATHAVEIHGVLETGELITYTAPVIPPGGPQNNSPVPPLYGLDSMARENVYFGTRNVMMAIVPDGREGEIQFPSGTRFRQCVKAPSGHWLLKVSHWTKHKKSDKQVRHAFHSSTPHPEPHQQASDLGQRISDGNVAGSAAHSA